MIASKLLPLLLLASLNLQAHSASLKDHSAGVRGQNPFPAGHESDSSDIEAGIFAAHQQQEQCWSKKQQSLFSVGESSPCEDLVNNPKPEIRGKHCECKLVESANGNLKPKWRVQNAGGEEGTVDAQFFGNIVGHAKLLCQVVEAISCWHSKGASGQSSVALVDENGEAKFVQLDKLLPTVRKICGVIDGGVGKLPGLVGDLIPGNGGGGIPGLIGNIIKLVTGGGGGGLLDGLFGSIFVAADGATTFQYDNQIAASDQIPLYTASQWAQSHNAER